MKKNYLTTTRAKWLIASIVLLGIIGFTASHAIVNDNENKSHGEDRIVVKIMKIENGDTTIIEKHYDDLDELDKLKHYLAGGSGAKTKINILDDTGDEHENVKIKIIDYDSDKGSIHKKIIVCSNEDTLEHEDIHINLRDIHKDIAEALEDLDIEIDLDSNTKKSLHKLMADFEMDIEIQDDDNDEHIKIIINGLRKDKKLQKLLKELDDSEAI